MMLNHSKYLCHKRKGHFQTRQALPRRMSDHKAKLRANSNALPGLMEVQDYSLLSKSLQSAISAKQSVRYYLRKLDEKKGWQHTQSRAKFTNKAVISLDLSLWWTRSS